MAANDVVFTTAKTMGFSVGTILLQVIPAKTVGSTSCVTQITVIATGDIYYTSTTVASLYTAGVFTGSAKLSFTSTIAAVDGYALASTQVTGLPSLGVMLEPVSITLGGIACVTKITLLATNKVFFTADTVAALIALT